jgi:hypothetical protein
MQARVPLFCVLLSTCAVTSSTAQRSWLPHLPAASEIVAAVGDTTAAGGLVARALRERLGEGHTGETVSVMRRQMPAEWLPLVPGVTFVLLDDVQAEAHWKACGNFLSIHRVARQGDELRLTVARGDRCSTSGIVASFTNAPNGWYTTAGLAGGFAGSRGHCDCAR